MKVIIIAAGFGSRFGTATKIIPKGLLDINGKSIIEKQIELFNEFDINDILIITGPYKNFGIENVKYIYDKDYQNHDVLGSLMAARNDISGEVLISYSDIIFDKKILQEILRFDGDIGIPVDYEWKEAYEDRSQHPISEADIVLIKNNKIIKIEKGIECDEMDGKLAEFLGLIKLSSKGSKIIVDVYKNLEKTHKGKFEKALSLKKAYLTDLFQYLINSGINIDPIKVSGKWCEIDTPQDLENARKIF